MNKLIGGVEGLPWAGSWSHLWRPSVCPKPAVSLLNQHVSLEIYSCTESTHTDTHTHPFEYTDIKDDIFILSVRPNTHPHVFTQKRARMQKRRQKKNIRANTWVETKSSHTHKYAHPRAWTNTWLARRFTPVWKDKHQPINKSVSRETCWHAQQQGSRSGRDERKVRGRQKKCADVCVCVCVRVCVGIQAD